MDFISVTLKEILSRNFITSTRGCVVFTWTFPNTNDHYSSEQCFALPVYDIERGCCFRSGTSSVEMQRTVGGRMVRKVSNIY